MTKKHINKHNPTVITKHKKGETRNGTTTTNTRPKKPGTRKKSKPGNLQKMPNSNETKTNKKKPTQSMHGQETNVRIPRPILLPNMQTMVPIRTRQRRNKKTTNHTIKTLINY